MRLAPLVLFAFAALPCRAGPAQDLVGTWRSDKNLTLSEIDAEGGMPAELREVLESILGELTFTYTATQATSSFEGDVDVHDYRVVGESADSVTIEFYDADAPGLVRREIFVSGDRMRVPVEKLGFDEIFTRVKGPAAAR
jgi:hypothetical protein